MINPKKYQCPLCLSLKTGFIEEINSKLLTKLYFSYLKIKIGRLLKGRHLVLYECSKCKLRFFYPPLTGDISFYNQLSKINWYYGGNKYEHKFAAKLIREKDRVLEIGAGDGSFANLINSNNYIGIDISHNAFLKAKTKGIHLLNLSLSEFSKKFPHIGKFNCVCLFQVLEHLTDIRDCLKQSVMFLNKGGKLIISVPSTSSSIHDSPNNILDLPPHHLSQWSDDTFRTVAKIFKLKILEIKHEPLAVEHVTLYVKTRFFLALKGPPKIPTGNLIENTLPFVLLAKVTYILGRLYVIFVYPLLKSIKRLPMGHTVIVVFQK